MANRKAYTLGGREFSTQGAAKQAVRDILYGTGEGENVATEHFEFLMDVLSMHTEADEKIGAGVASFYVALTSHRSLGLHLRRHDGSETEWSFHHCFTPRSKTGDAMQGFQQELAGRKIAYRDHRYGGSDMIPCDETGNYAPKAHSFVTHRNPEFGVLVDGFLRERGLEIDQIVVDPTRDGDATRRLTDRGLAQAWLAYHAKNANMRIVAKPRRRGHTPSDG